MSSHPSSDPDESPAASRSGGDEEKFDTQPGEADLWELDSDFTPPAEAVKLPKQPKFHRTEPEKRSADTPPPSAVPLVPRGPRREELAFKAPLSADGPPESEDPSSTLPASKPSPVRRRVTDTFADLEDETTGTPGEKTAPAKAKASSKPPVSEPAAEPPTDDLPAPETPETTGQSETEPAAPPPGTTPAKGFSLPKIQLSKLERIGLVGFLVLFAAAGFFYHAQSLNKLPEKKEALTPDDLPIKGKRITALEIKSYWREPITDDRARRGTSLLPVVELKMEGGPAAVRVLFRNSAKEYVGDAITRQVKGGTSLKIAATAGFEEIGMYASYRTGDTAPWLIEVLEGPAEGGSGSDFKKLFEIPVSTERR
jgi:hypothetical protein